MKSELNKKFYQLVDTAVIKDWNYANADHLMNYSWEVSGDEYDELELIVCWIGDVDRVIKEIRPWQAVIYDHAFAQALFGELPYRIFWDMGFAQQYKGNHKSFKGSISLANHEFHLQQAIIMPDPVDYLFRMVGP